MSRYKTKGDAAFSLVMLLTVGFVTILVFAEIDMAAAHRWRYFKNWQLPHILVYLVLVAAYPVVRWQLLRSGIRWWTYIWVGVATFWSFLVFGPSLHDLEIYYDWGLHGHFGCSDGKPHLINDGTVSLAAFGPLFVFNLARLLRLGPPVNLGLGKYWRWLTTFERKR